jgi:hypothetical protein
MNEHEGAEATVQLIRERCQRPHFVTYETGTSHAIIWAGTRIVGILALSRRSGVIKGVYSRCTEEFLPFLDDIERTPEVNHAINHWQTGTLSSSFFVLPVLAAPAPLIEAAPDGHKPKRPRRPRRSLL